MSDESYKNPVVSAENPTPAAESIKAPPVQAQEGALIGDEAVYSKMHKVEVDVHKDAVPAQVVAKADPPPSEVYVHETSVKLDRVITDPSSPEAVQVPDAGRGSLDLPIHALDAPTVEEVFAKEAASVDERDEDEPLPGDPTAPNPDAHE